MDCYCEVYKFGLVVSYMLSERSGRLMEDRIILNGNGSQQLIISTMC